MGRLPNFFYDLSEALNGMDNYLVNTSIPVPQYRASTEIPKTGMVPPHPPIVWPIFIAIWITLSWRCKSGQRNRLRYLKEWYERSSVSPLTFQISPRNW